MRLTEGHLLILIAIAIIIFGAPRLPGMAKSLGQSMRIFKSEMKQMKDETSTATAKAADDAEDKIIEVKEDIEDAVADATESVKKATGKK